MRKALPDYSHTGTTTILVFPYMQHTVYYGWPQPIDTTIDYPHYMHMNELGLSQQFQV